MSKRGFASMTPEQRRKIASMGGKAVPASKRTFTLKPGLAAAAGRKGGSSVDPANRTFTKDREFAAKCGRKGGKSKKPKELLS